MKGNNACRQVKIINFGGRSLLSFHTVTLQWMWHWRSTCMHWLSYITLNWNYFRMVRTLPTQIKINIIYNTCRFINKVVSFVINVAICLELKNLRQWLTEYNLTELSIYMHCERHTEDVVIFRKQHLIFT